MATFEIKMAGLDEARARLTTAAARLDSATKSATVAAASTVQIAILNELRKSSHQKGTVTPAAPGQPPSLITGTLLRSIVLKGPVGSAGVYTAEIGPSAVYGRIQELGGDTGRGHRTHLPARPYVAPAWAKVSAEIPEIYTSAWAWAFE